MSKCRTTHHLACDCREEMFAEMQKRLEELEAELSKQKYKNIEPLLNAVDTAVWCWEVKKNTKKERGISVDWKKAFDELSEAFQSYQIKTLDCVAVIPEEPSELRGEK